MSLADLKKKRKQERKERINGNNATQAEANGQTMLVPAGSSVSVHELHKIQRKRTAQIVRATGLLTAVTLA